MLADERQIDGDGFFSFKLDAAQVRPETGLSARLIDDGQEPHQGQAPSEARFPAGGEAFTLGAAWPGIALRVVLVPLRYDADGSGRLPDLSAAQIERYRALLRATYPVINVELTVRDPVPWDESLTLSGDVKFDTLNDLLSGLRFDDKAPPDAYYYGLIAPADSLDDYCIVSCVTGQSFVVEDPEDEGSRVGAGMGFLGDDSAWTLAHELGHMHGRDHARATSTTGTQIFHTRTARSGVRGHDERTGAFIEPTKARDMMGYCEPNWVSDYTYSALFDRVKALGALQGASIGAAPQFFTIHEEPGGAMSWGKLARRTRLPHRRHEARWVGPGGEELGPAAAARVARSHGGATWLIEPPPPGARWLDLGSAGFLELDR